MSGTVGSPAGTGSFTCSELKPRIVIGVTSAQTCLVLKGRIRALKDAGFDVTVVSSPGAQLERIGEEEGGQIQPVPMERKIALARDFLSLLRLYWVLRDQKPAIVEFSTPKAGLLGLVAARLVGVPKRVYLLRGLKFETASGLKRLLLCGAERLSARLAHTVLCTSESVRQTVLALGIVPPVKLKMLGKGSSIGVDVGRFSPGPSDMRRELGIPASARVIGFVGRLTRDKGLPELLDAFKRILDWDPSAILLLVGWFDTAEDALSVELKSRILSHPRIVWAGFVQDPVPYYRVMEVLVLPTLREGFPNTILEASAMGLPVVATTATGSRDAVVPGVTGILVAPGDVNAMSEAVLRLLENNALRRQMGAAGREWVSQNFASQKILALNAEFFKSQLVSPAPAREPR